MSLPSADSKNFIYVVEKRFGMNKFVRTKNPTGSKFSKNIFEQLCTAWTVVVRLCCGFSLWRQMAPQQTACTRLDWSISYQFEDIANYASI